MSDFSPVSSGSASKPVLPDEMFPDWYISVSFKKSTSKSFDQAIALAKTAPMYLETKSSDGRMVFQAVYSAEKESYLKFITLFNLVKNWKSCFVTINGSIVDKKSVGQLNYCYGDCCRSGDPYFCYGASPLTDNPFGCHRLQISAGNTPWFSHGYLENHNTWVVDKDFIRSRARSFSYVFRYCPNFNWERIEQTIDDLPDRINLDKNPDCYISSGELVKPFMTTINVSIENQNNFNVTETNSWEEPIKGEEDNLNTACEVENESEHFENSTDDCVENATPCVDQPAQETESTECKTKEPEWWKPVFLEFLELESEKSSLRLIIIMIALIFFVIVLLTVVALSS